MMRNSRGFTIVEIMIGIAIAAVVTAFAIPAYNKYVTKTKVAEAFHMAGPYKVGIVDCVQSGSDYKNCHSETYSIPARMEGKYGHIYAESGHIVFEFDKELEAGSDLYGKHLTFYSDSFNENTSAIKWYCKFSASFNTNFIPASAGCVPEDEQIADNNSEGNNSTNGDDATSNPDSSTSQPSEATDTSGTNVFSNTSQVEQFFGGKPVIDGNSTNSNWFVSVWTGTADAFNNKASDPNFSYGGQLKTQDGTVIKDLDQFCPAGYIGVLGNTSRNNPSNAGLFCIKKQ